MKVIVALDASDPAQNALEFLTRVRWPGGSRTIVLTVMEPVASPLVMAGEVGRPSRQKLVDHRWREAEEQVRHAEQLLRTFGFSADGHIVVGDPREMILQFASNERADLIVMGSHGRTGLAKLVLGSVSSHVATHAPCAVLMVK